MLKCGKIDDCTAHFIDETSQDLDPSNVLTIWLCHFLAQLQKKHYVPDAVIELLLCFLVGFFSVIGKLSPQLSKISQSFPSTLYKMQQLVCPPTSFARYIACDKCYKIYEHGECIKKVGTLEIPKLCMQKHLNHGRPCQGRLLRRVELLHGKQI